MKMLRSLRCLIAMQLKNLIDLSFMRSKRTFLLKSGMALVSFAVVTAAFYLFFSVASMLSVFSFGRAIPDTVVTVLLTLIQIMSIWSCMCGLSRTLYRGGDNVTLLVLPVPQNLVFLSKLAVYYVFELKRSFMLTVPLFLAYGIVNGAVWFYYPWMLFCFLFITMLPVLLGAVLSIPALYVPKLLERVPALKYGLLVAAAGAFVAAAFWIVGLIPSNINILGQWGSISQSVQTFLLRFRTIFAPWHYLTLMTVGGTLGIASTPVTGRGALTWLILAAVLAALIAVSFFTARILFLKLTAQAGENERRLRKNRPNRVHSKTLSPLFEDLLRSFRSGKAVWRTFVEFFLPAFLLFALNRIYAAMNTSLSGQTMTATFNVLVLLVTVLSANTFLAHTYSRDGDARNLLKTRPVDFRLLLVSRLLFRAVCSTLSILAAVTLYYFVAGIPAEQAAGLAVTAVFFDLAHILWCGEIDVMNPERKEGGGNEVKATAFALIIAVGVTAFFYLISGSVGAFWKLAAIAVAFFALRAFLYFERVRIYFIKR